MANPSQPSTLPSLATPATNLVNTRAIESNSRLLSLRTVNHKIRTFAFIFELSQSSVLNIKTVYNLRQTLVYFSSPYLLKQSLAYS